MMENLNNEYLAVFNVSNKMAKDSKLRKEYDQTRQTVSMETDKAFDSLQKIINGLGSKQIEDMKLNVDFENVAHHLGMIRGYVE